MYGQGTSPEMYDNAFGTHNVVQAVGTDELVNEQLRRARSGERDNVVQFGGGGQDVYQRDKQERRPNIRLGQDAVTPMEC
jgi:hypothetical protein